MTRVFAFGTREPPPLVRRSPQPPTRDTLFSVGAIRTPKASRRVSGVRPLLFPRTRTHRSSLNSKTQWTTTRVSGNGTTQFESSETNLEINATANIGSTFQNWTVDQNFTYAVTVEILVECSLSGLFLNGKESPDLTLLKGYTYVFACNTGTNSFYLSTQLNSTAFAGEYTHSNLSGSRATSGDLVFTVPNDFDTNVTLYYCSSQNAFMGNAIQVIESIPDSTIIPFPTQTSITPSVSHDLSLKATFNLNQYLVSINSGTGGSLTQGTSGTYLHGDSIIISAEADAHYSFSHWEGGTFASPTSQSTTATISSDTSSRQFSHP